MSDRKTICCFKREKWEWHHRRSRPPSSILTSLFFPGHSSSVCKGLTTGVSSNHFTFWFISSIRRNESISFNFTCGYFTTRHSRYSTSVFDSVLLLPEAALPVVSGSESGTEPDLNPTPTGGRWTNAKSYTDPTVKIMQHNSVCPINQFPCSQFNLNTLTISYGIHLFIYSRWTHLQAPQASHRSSVSSLLWWFRLQSGRTKIPSSPLSLPLLFCLFTVSSPQESHCKRDIF